MGSMFVAGFELGAELIGILGVGGIGLLEAWWTHPSPQVQRGWIHASHDDASHCPYCHEGFAETEDPARLSCATCQVVHHTACWEDHGGCSVYGCRALAPSPRRRARVAVG